MNGSLMSELQIWIVECLIPIYFLQVLLELDQDSRGLRMLADVDMGCQDWHAHWDPPHLKKGVGANGGIHTST